MIDVEIFDSSSFLRDSVLESFQVRTLRILEANEDEFFILAEATLQGLLTDQYRQYLETHDFRRPRNPFSTHAGIKNNLIQNYKDKWDAITTHFLPNSS